MIKEEITYKYAGVYLPGLGIIIIWGGNNFTDEAFQK